MFALLDAAYLVALALFIYFILRPTLFTPPTSLAGRRILITGAAHGIGAELAVGAAARGARLVLWDLDGAALRDVAARARDALRGAGVAVSERDSRAVVAAELDVASPEALAAAQGEAAKLRGAAERDDSAMEAERKLRLMLVRRARAGARGG